MSNSNRPRTVLDQPDSGGPAASPSAPPWAAPRPQSPPSMPGSSAPFGAPPSFGGGRAATELEPGSNFGNPAPATPYAQAPAASANPAAAGRSSTVWVPPEPATPAAGGAPAAAAPAAAKAPARKITGWLVASDRLQAFTLHEGANRVGRGLENEVVIDNPTISGFQCNLYCREQGLHLMPDPRLTNPIELNGEPIFATTQLFGPARIKMGNAEWMIVLLPDSAL